MTPSHGDGFPVQRKHGRRLARIFAAAMIAAAYWIGRRQRDVTAAKVVTAGGPFVPGKPNLWVAWILAVGVIVAAYVVWHMSRERDVTVARVLTAGDPSRAPALIRRYGCGGCHTISAAPGADGKVAPPLDHLRERVFIGGVVRNTPDALIRWIVSPQSFSPRSAMPATGITEDEARDVAAFLYAH